MKIYFDKMQGCGNDFMVIDRLAQDASPGLDEGVVRHLADRRLGIGFDQLLIIEATDAAAGNDAVAAYRIFNADGSPAAQCGNGARCIARLMHERHGAGEQFTMRGPVGPVHARINADGVAIGMGAPALEGLDFPVGAGRDLQGRYTVEVDGETVTLSAVSMGNPHAVLMVDDIAAAPVTRLGSRLQQHPAFPDGVNVGFLQPVTREHGRLRVFERGAGETPACGSGGCAAAVAGMLAGAFADNVALDLPGGTLVLSWRGPGHDVWLQGPALRVFEGHITL